MPRRFLALVLLVGVLVVAGLVVVARGLEGRDASIAPADVPAPAEAWTQVEPGCARDVPRCRVPRAVEVDGRVLERTSLRLAPVPVTAGAATSRTQARVDLPARRSWLMTGVIGPDDAGASGYRVEVGDAFDEVATDRPLLLRVEAAPLTAAPVSVTARRPRGEGARQFLAVYVERADAPGG